MVVNFDNNCDMATTDCRHYNIICISISYVETFLSFDVMQFENVEGRLKMVK